MKYLFVADLHIKVGQKNVPREWAKNRVKIMFDELSRVKHEYGVDAEIHGGDIFDKLPNLDELGLYLNYISKCLNPVHIIDGNHEATKKGETFFDLLRDVLNSINPNVNLMTDYYYADEKFPFDAIPYCRLKDFEKNYAERITKFQGKALVTHVRGEIPPHVTPEIDLNKLNRWDVVFAGDLHSHSNTQRNIVYPGSPVTVSFHRNPVDTGVLIIDDSDMSWKWVKLNVPQLLRRTVSDPEDMVKTDYDHTIYELEGDALDLAKVSKENDLLDKKLVKHNSTSTLDLSNMTVQEELALYLKQIVALDEDKLKKALEVFSDNIIESSMG